MAGSTIGKLFTVTTWGESHGPALGAVIDGCPAGIALDPQMIQADLERRRPGKSAYTSSRKEVDQVEILSGVFRGFTTGTPISLIIRNVDQHSADYDHLAEILRPGHADCTYWQKYGIRDYRGGGRASGRETAARVAAGAVARQLLAQFDVKITGYTYAIGEISINPDRFEPDLIYSHPLAMPDRLAAAAAEQYIKKYAAKHDSVGGVVECVVSNLPPGLGEPVFAKLDALLAQALFSIGAVKAVEIGSGFRAATMTGSEHNDCFHWENGKLSKTTNHAGGVLGGISDGSPLILRVYFKPTPSIAKTQKTATITGDNIEVQITGRHDPVIVPRAVVVVEAMIALTLADCLLMAATSTINNLKRLFSHNSTPAPHNKLGG